jgi:hypothetical protein
MYSSWEVAAAIIKRISGQEIHLTMEELEAVRGTVPIAEYHPGKVVYRIGTPEAWPESEKRIDVIGQNGNTGEHYAKMNMIIGDAFCYGTSYAQNGKHIPHDEVMRGNDDFEVDGA